MADLRDKILDQHAEIRFNSGKSVKGSLEYFAKGKTLAVIDEDELETTTLSVPRDEAPEAFDALEPDQVLIRNWAPQRGAAFDLEEQGRIELTGDEVKVGMFGLQAFVARVL